MSYTPQALSSQTSTRCTWREVLPVHPAADLFPRMSPDELLTLAEDIKERGLVSPIVIYKEVGPDGFRFSLLDGINRLDAMELVGIKFKLHLTKLGDWVMLH
jgi:hypothetical protein